MRKITQIFIHHSASNWGNATLIDIWHKERGFSEIGYHFVVCNGYLTSEDYKRKNIDEELIGKIEKGRNIEKVGSHVLNYNSNSIGVCLIHSNLPYTEKQLEAYRNLVAELALQYNVKVENIKGHCEVDKSKPLCPSLEMNRERKIIAELVAFLGTRI